MPLITILVIGPNLRFAGPPKRARRTQHLHRHLSTFDSMPSRPRTLPASGVMLTRDKVAGGHTRRSTKKVSTLQNVLQGYNLACPRASRLSRDPTS
ncbi:hypothetical protein IG631_06292 [Alternaria alternata]|nr:hypothetical protein IG631_06292 [Alternaria alternata]